MEEGSIGLVARNGVREDGCRGGAPGQIWSSGPHSVLLSAKGLRQLWDDSGTTLYVVAAAPASAMCRVGMSDAGLGPNIQTNPRV